MIQRKKSLCQQLEGRYLKYKVKCEWKEDSDPSKACVPQLAFNVPLDDGVKVFKMVNGNDCMVEDIAVNFCANKCVYVLPL